MSPAFLKLATRVYQESLKIWFPHNRFKTQRLLRQHEEDVDKLSMIDEKSDFRFASTPLSNGTLDNLLTLAETIFSILQHEISKPRKGLSYIILEQKNFEIIGDFWARKPNIYLFDFVGQQQLSKDNIDKFKVNFGRILSRGIVPNEEALRILPKDCRVFSDYSLFLKVHATTRMGKRRDK